MGLTNTYRLYLQQTNGLFALEPALTYGDKVEPFSWLCWADLNHDGKVDLIKSVWLNEPSFVPGVPGGKVLVSTYIADEHGRLPAQPQQIFRKNDWLLLLPVVDVDGDGFLDLVLGYGHMDSREGVRKQVTAKQARLHAPVFLLPAGRWLSQGSGLSTGLAHPSRSCRVAAGLGPAAKLPALRQARRRFQRRWQSGFAGAGPQRGHLGLLLHFATERVQHGTGPALQLPGTD